MIREYSGDGGRKLCPLASPASPVSPLSPLDTTSLPPASKSLPVINSIPILNLKSDFYAWDEGVCTLLQHLGIHGHILDPNIPIVLHRPDLSPSIRPLLSESPTPTELSAFHRWNDNDNVAQYVLIGRLGSLAHQLLPSTEEWTSYLIYQAICKYFGLRNFTDCTVLASSLWNLRCEPNKVQDYVARWRAGVSHLCSAKFPFSVRVYIQDFVNALPQTLAFATLRALLPSQLDRITNDFDLGTFITVTNDAMDLDIAFRNSHGHRQAPHAPSSTISSTPAKPSGVTPTSTVPVEAPPRINCSSLFCNNCKSTGHIDPTCFKEGGGMAGHHEEYLNDKGHVHAMLAQCLEDTFLTSDTSPSSPPVSPIPTLDDQTIVPVAVRGLIISPILWYA